MLTKLPALMADCDRIKCQRRVKYSRNPTLQVQVAITVEVSHRAPYYYRSFVLTYAETQETGLFP